MRFIGKESTYDEESVPGDRPNAKDFDLRIYRDYEGAIRCDYVDRGLLKRIDDGLDTDGKRDFRYLRRIR